MLSSDAIGVTIKVSVGSKNHFHSIKIVIEFLLDRLEQPRKVPIYSDARLREIVVAGHETPALIRDYWDAVRQFLETNDPKHLAPFEGIVVVDVAGRSYVFETRLNILYRLSIVS
jgi:hypothetical protein